jgi:hypothetical protein
MSSEEAVKALLLKGLADWKLPRIFFLKFLETLGNVVLSESAVSSLECDIK